MGLVSDFVSMLNTNKLKNKKTLTSIVIIILCFFDKVNEINMIIQATLLTLVFVVIKMLYTVPHQIDLEDYILKNCIGMLSFITILKKIPSLIKLPDGIIKSINNFINNTDTIAGTLMDGNPPASVDTQNIDINGTTKGIELNKEITFTQDQTQSQTTNIVEKTIIKSILEKVINGL